MKEQISQFVLRAVTAKSFGKKGQSLECPEFFEKDEAWAQAFEYAASIHASTPLAVNIENSDWFGKLPEKARLTVEEAVRRERMLLAILDQELEVGVHFLSRARIPVILLKGMDVGRRYYPARIYRPMTDADILTPYHLFQESLRALGRAGFRVSGPMPPGRFRVELARKQGGPVLEVHQMMLAGETEEKMSEIWLRSMDSAIQISESGLTCRGLAIEDNLAYLVQHAGVQHAIESPIWLNDIHYLIQSKEFEEKGDWERVAWALADCRAASAGWFVLTFLKNNWGTQIPESALKSLGKNAGILRRSLLSKMLEPEKWFPMQGRSLPWLVRSRYLLRDSALDAVKYGIKRKSSQFEHWA